MIGIGEQTCGMAVPMQILIGSGVGAGERSSCNEFMSKLKIAIARAKI